MQPLNLDKLRGAGANISARLARIRESIGAPPGDYESPIGIVEIGAEELREFSAARPDKPIIVDGKLHLVYIKDHSNGYYHREARRATNTAENGCYHRGNRIHFYCCEKLREMEEAGKQKRYRRTPNISSMQTVDLPEEENARIRLPWCQCCIWEFQSDLRKTPRFPKRDEWIKGKRKELAKYGDAESLKKFFQPRNPLWSDFIAALDSPAAPSGYPSNWNSISAAFRRAKNYTCEICGVDCRTHTGLTDAHHINGDKSDCRYKNLQCLCIYHHSQQPMHEHYKPTESEMQILRQLWEAQNILAHLRG